MNNKEFLFLYEAINCNPNGDPDRDNEPRMDKATKTNLVSDVRLKRFIRDYLIDFDQPVFVSTVGGQKVKPETRLLGFIKEIEKDEKLFNELADLDDDFKKSLEKYKAEIITFKDSSLFQIFHQRNTTGDLKKEVQKGNAKEEQKLSAEEKSAFKDRINNSVLVALVRTKFLDIRYFGGAFAIGDFNQTITGAIQVSIGYSLHPVELCPLPIATIMSGTSEGNSNMGRKEGLYYSLISFIGTINAKRAEFNKLNEETDLQYFRKSIISSVQEHRTTSKFHYPKLYLEIEYTDKYSYGCLGDLRSYIKVSANTTKANSSVKSDFIGVRSLSDLKVDFTELYAKIKSIEEKIKNVRIWKSEDMISFDIKEILLTKEVEGEQKNKLEKIDIDKIEIPLKNKSEGSNSENKNDTANI